MGIGKPFNRGEERDLLDGWLSTVTFDDLPTGIPDLEPEDDDEDDSEVPSFAAGLGVVAVQDDGTLLVTAGGDLAAVVTDGEITVTAVSAAAGYGDWHPAGDARVPAALAARIVSLFDADRRFKRDKGGKFAKVNELFSRPKDEAGWQTRQQHVQAAMDQYRGSLSTDETFAIDGAWTPDRDRMHRELAAEIYAAAANVPNDRKAVIAGGLGGAGKSTVLKGHAGVDTSQFLTLNPDDVKTTLADRGLVPEVPDAPDLSPMERAALVHEESSRITGLVADMAQRDGKNVIWDVTMSSLPSTQRRIAALRKFGYADVNGVFVDIPTETSVSRALSRYRRGQEAWYESRGQGGRYVPPDIIRAASTSSGTTVNRQVFEELRGQFTSWSIYDNSVDGAPPVLVDASAPAPVQA